MHRSLNVFLGGSLMSPVYYMTQINNGTDISEWTWGEFYFCFIRTRKIFDPEMQTKLNKKHDE